MFKSTLFSSPRFFESTLCSSPRFVRVPCLFESTLCSSPRFVEVHALFKSSLCSSPCLVYSSPRFVQVNAVLTRPPVVQNRVLAIKKNHACSPSMLIAIFFLNFGPNARDRLFYVHALFSVHACSPSTIVLSPCLFSFRFRFRSNTFEYVLKLQGAKG